MRLSRATVLSALLPVLAAACGFLIVRELVRSAPPTTRRPLGVESSGVESPAIESTMLRPDRRAATPAELFLDSPLTEEEREAIRAVREKRAEIRTALLEQSDRLLVVASSARASDDDLRQAIDEYIEARDGLDRRLRQIDEELVDRVSPRTRAKLLAMGTLESGPGSSAGFDAAQTSGLPGDARISWMRGAGMPAMGAGGIPGRELGAISPTGAPPVERLRGTSSPTAGRSVTASGPSDGQASGRDGS